MTSYYMIGYYSTHPAQDGKFRRVRVTLAGGRAGELAYRQGYYADKTFAKLTGAENERQLEEALMLEDPVTDITIAMEVNYFQLNRAEYFVPVAVKIPGQRAGAGAAPRRAAHAARLHRRGEGRLRRDDPERARQARHRLSDQTAAELVARPIQYETGFTLLPGKYVIKFLARDAEAGRIGTYQTSFTIPNLNREETRLPISSVVLGSQRVPMAEALHNAKTADSTSLVHPLVSDGLKLLPSVTRVFATGRDLHVYLQAYERGADATRPLVAFVTFYQGDVKVFETQPMAVTEGLDPRSKAVPIRVTVPLADVAPGRYECQVTVLEPGGQKVAFWRSPIAVVR